MNDPTRKKLFRSHFRSRIYSVDGWIDDDSDGNGDGDGDGDGDAKKKKKTFRRGRESCGTVLYTISIIYAGMG